MSEHREIVRQGGPPSVSNGRVAKLAILMASVFLAASVFAQDTITNVMSPVVSYQFQDSLGAYTNSVLISPVVSYQFHDSLEHLDTNSVIISPVVSYQYFDWPDAGSVQFLNSLPVSYFYNAGLPGPDVAVQGRVVDALGAPVSGATVSAAVLTASGVSAPTAGDGTFALPALSPGVYVLAASRSGLVADRRMVALSASTARQDFRLLPLLPLPNMQTAGSTPPFILPPPDDYEGSVLRVFDGTNFVANLALLDRSKMTVVLSHGWIPAWTKSAPSPVETGWPKSMALALKTNGVLTLANIVAWDWTNAATSWWPPPAGKTPKQGLGLGKALYQALHPDYATNIHFIGHSLGTLVNAAAANYLHGHAVGQEGVANPPWLPARAHLTLSDEAELASEITIWNGLVVKASPLLRSSAQSTYSPLARTGYMSPIPLHASEYAWIDNYISAIGLYRPEAVNVHLQKAANDFDAGDQIGSFETMHSYSWVWYQASIERVGESLMGFTNSFERRLLSPVTPFPPLPAMYQPGKDSGMVFRQVVDSSERLQLEAVPCVDCWQISAPWVQLAVMRRLVPQLAASVWSSGARIYGDVVMEAYERTTVTITDGANYLVEQATQAGQQSVDLVNGVWLRLRLLTGSGGGGSLRAKDGDGTGTNMPAYVWLPVAVPADAAAMVFDFTITGDGVEDTLAFGINGTNLFSVETKFIPTNQLTASRLIDVAAYAGTTNELFFGILGGTSTNCSAQVEGIRFFTFSTPSLVIIVDTNGRTELSWPSTASGFALESAANLSGGPWSEVTNTPALFGGRFTVTNQWADQTRFFRLRPR